MKTKATVTPEDMRVSARAVVIGGHTAYSIVLNRVGRKWTDRFMTAFERNKDRVIELAEALPPKVEAELHLLDLVLARITGTKDRELVIAAKSCQVTI